MAVTKLDSNQMKMLQKMHMSNLMVCEIDKEEVKLQNDAKAAYKNTQQQATKKLLVGISKNEPRNRMRADGNMTT